MSHALVRLFGWKATLFHGDPTVYDRWEWIEKNLDKGPHRTLDAGCGSGAYTLYAARVNREAVGISFSQRNTEAAEQRALILNQSNVQFIEADLRKIDYFSPGIGLFDQAMCMEVIEHLLDDQKVVNHIAAVLKPGAKLLISVPYKRHVPVRGEIPDPNYTTTKEDGGHVRYGYTEGELKKILKRAGFEVVKTSFISGVISQKLYNFGCDLNAKLPHKLAWTLSFPLRLFQPFDKWITRKLRYPHLSVAMVAIKKGS